MNMIKKFFRDLFQRFKKDRYIEVPENVYPGRLVKAGSDGNVVGLKRSDDLNQVIGQVEKCSEVPDKDGYYRAEIRLMNHDFIVGCKSKERCD